MSDLPINVDASYPDDADDPSRALHQQHHDALHAVYNELKGTTAVSAALLAKLDDYFLLKSLVDAKGDLLVATANDTIARLAAGTNGHVLTADSAEAAGVKWAAAAGGSSGVAAVSTSRSSGNVTCNNTGAFTADVDTALDLVIPAVATDVIELTLSGRWASSAVFSGLNMVTRVAGADVNFISAGTLGVASWYGDTGREDTIAGGVLYTVQAGDISGGNVTFRLRYRTDTATNKALYADSFRPLVCMAKNLG